ncbi:MAG: hypothetical protein HFH68_03940 [Lachnospiraceae bacterium]|nr:hypothetical protein [Lachnospiraceae bacterium]
MKKPKFLAFLIAALLITLSFPSFTNAASRETPASIVARLTGRSVEDVIREKLDTGKTYGTIAKENGKLKEFQKECLSLKEKALKQDVKNGYLSQKEADKILAAIKANQETCDGTGNGNCGYGNGAGYGNGKGRGGNGAGYGNGRGRGGNGAGYGKGYGICNNYCIYNS